MERTGEIVLITLQGHIFNGYRPDCETRDGKKPWCVPKVGNLYNSSPIGDSFPNNDNSLATIQPEYPTGRSRLVHVILVLAAYVAVANQDLFFFLVLPFPKNSATIHVKIAMKKGMIHSVSINHRNLKMLESPSAVLSFWSFFPELLAATAASRSASSLP